jgi:FHA domain
MDPITNGNGWKLEVVRGKDAGRVFALGVGEVVIGNAPGEGSGLDLASQESASSPRRMAARHASLDCSPKGLTLRDLESPGGTFVNRQRVLPGQAKPLQPGDVIQLGGVQLKVVGAQAPTAPSTQAPISTHSGSNLGAFTYAIPGGPTCRSWDDVLTASAQRWSVLREELVSGKLAGFLVSIGRGELAPSPRTPGTPDERLDAWLGSLPTTKEARPELDVHPSRLVIRVTPGGGTIRRSVQVANVGLRLMKSTATVEPTGVPWLKLEAPFAGQTFVTLEGTDVWLEVAIPEKLPAPLTAELVIDGNGGSKRIKVILEAKPVSGEVIETSSPSGAEAPSNLTFSDLIARQSPVARVATWSFAALVVRLLVGVASGSIGADAMTASGGDSPRLVGVAVMLAGVGGLLGGVLASRRGGPREIPTGAFAGGFAGVIGAAALVACCRSVEPFLGGWSTSIIAVCGLWGMIGAALAGLSILFVKRKS